jgi:hypothetical protein
VIESRQAWISEDDQGHVVAYLTIELVDDAVHIAQVSVLPDVARRRVWVQH